MRHHRRIGALCAAALSVTLLAAGCSGSDDGDSDGRVVGSVDRGPKKEVRQSGDKLRVVALGWSDGEIALSLGVKPVAIYDWQGHGEKNKGVGPWAAKKFGDSKVDVIKNSGTSYNYEQIELLEPDLILNVRAAGDSKVFNRLAKIAPVAAAPGGTGDFAVDWRKQTEIIGKAIGEKSAAKKAVSETSDVIEKTAAQHPEFKGKRFVYGAKFGDAYGAYLKGDARFDTFAELGFAANPPVQKLDASGFFANVSAEQVKALDGQVGVFTTIGLPLKSLTGDKLISSLDIVKDKRAVILDEQDEVNAALAAGTPQSVALAVEKVAPSLSKAAKRVS